MPSAHESAARWLTLDELCDRFEEACLAGTKPRLEEFLRDVPAERRGETIRELLKVDTHYRQRVQDWPSVAEYRARFPEIDSVWLRTLLTPPSSRAHLESPGAMSARERFLDDPTVLPSVPGYEMIGMIGRGGMGVVYKARQVALNRLVALKMVLAGELAGPETLARFRAEARAVAQLQHPNLVQIYEVGEHDGRPYLAFEYVAGGGLDQRLRGEPQPPSAAARLIKTLAHAMQFAHSRAIVHRDLKPANILLATVRKPLGNEPHTAMLLEGLSSEAGQPVPLPEPRLNSSVENATLSGGEPADIYGHPKISDFGLAKDLENNSQQTRTGAILGTPSYMAPEQAAGRAEAIGPATDVYALGAILYEMLTGRPPFRAPTVIETLDQVRSLEPLSLRRIQPTVPRDLDTICLKCLHKDPARRYASAGALADDLDRYLRDEPVLARPVSSTERTWRWCRRRPLVATLALLLLLVTCGGIGGIFHQWQQAETSRELAEDNALAARRQRDAADTQRQLADANRKLAEQNAQVAEVHRLAAVAAREEAENFQKLAEINQARAETRVENSRSTIQELLKVGNDLIKKPQMESVGRDVLQKANRLQESLLEEKSTDPAIRLETARARRTFGWTQFELGQHIEAEASTQKAIALARSLLSETPEHLEARRELRSAVAQLAYIQRGLGQRDEASASFRESIRISEELIYLTSSKPDDQNALANILTNFAAYQLTLGRSADAQSALDRSVGILRQLVQSQPRSATYRAELALALAGLAGMEWSRDRESAEKLGREALAIRRQLLREQPNSRDLPGYLSRSAQQVAEWCLATGRDEEADELLEEGFDWLLRVVANHPLHHGQRRRLLEVTERRRDLAMKRGDTAQADELLQLQVEHTRMYVANVPDSTADRLRLAKTLTTWARRQAELGEKPFAAQAFLDAIAEYKRLQKDSPGQAKYRQELIEMMNEFIQLGRAAAGEARIIAMMEERLRQVPQDPGAMNSVAWWLSVARDKSLLNPARAVGLARKAVALRPDLAPFRNTLGTALYRADKLTEARVEFEKSLELTYKEPALNWYFLAAIAHREGRTEEAQKLFDQAQADHLANHADDDDHTHIAAEVQALLE